MDGGVPNATRRGWRPHILAHGEPVAGGVSPNKVEVGTGLLLSVADCLERRGMLRPKLPKTLKGPFIHKWYRFRPFCLNKISNDGFLEQELTVGNSNRPVSVQPVRAH